MGRNPFVIQVSSFSALESGETLPPVLGRNPFVIQVSSFAHPGGNERAWRGGGSVVIPS